MRNPTHIHPLLSLLRGLVVMAPLGYGLPSLVQQWAGLAAGVVLLLLLLPPSALGTGLLAQRIGRTPTPLSWPVLGCGGGTLWSLLGGVWVCTVLTGSWIAGGRGTDRSHAQGQAPDPSR